MQNIVKTILDSYTGIDMELIPILQNVQHKFGYLPEDAMREVADFLRIPESRVYGVATFYEQFRFTPVGKTKVTVCRGTACHVRGAQKIIASVEKRLGIKEGETTEDGEYTLETAACIGCCALAPCVMINEEVEANLTPKKMNAYFDQKEEANDD
ncbi:NADH-quinone oxidoreductase subunit NuoE [Desulfotalea psychrophila]|uniref:Probable NADH-ubiquinone oxidoreductase, 24 kDa subunit n=1 Tax=Desulfotalea psychrophila (strain LSv54 / DSM 12343) TaxID=177439 RepID=Q6AQG0_DESPS|nr:NADH-quinone oxidoreductase subunit NuoE [Desulfotalea psychrophila]CAG35413.1 probable NADH-ubiquinone oxidoreductase, 24 kDa subunit [Desulfotalea psychrophila LSv54]